MQPPRYIGQRAQLLSTVSLILPAVPQGTLQTAWHPYDVSQASVVFPRTQVVLAILTAFSPNSLPMRIARLAQSVLAVFIALLASGCATLTGEPTQTISVQTFDAQGRVVEGMRCKVVNGSAEYFGNSPMFSLTVRRSSSDLDIECTRGDRVARATAISRGGRASAVAKAILPGGTAGVLVDHLTGYRYDYPTNLHLRIGHHLVFDASDDESGRPSKGVLADSPR